MLQNEMVFAEHPNSLGGCVSGKFSALGGLPGICYSRRAMPVSENTGLERGLGLKEAVALNMIEIVGIGPFVVSSLVIKAMGGPQALFAWIGGAILAVIDGFVWAELGAAMPRAGGTYIFLREAYGPERLGRLMSFLY